MGSMGRDVEVSVLPGGQVLVVACDSCGAIGNKDLDMVQVPPRITGRFTARVALLEVLAAGAEPKIMTVAISNEPDPTGEGILAGVYEELESLKLGHLPMAISTEKNMTTRQTGLGISVVGVCDEASLRLGTTQTGDFIYGLGFPKVGQELKTSEDPEIINGDQIRKLLAYPGVHDVIPIGSQGIRKEAELLARSMKGEFRLEKDVPVDVAKSAGPATALIFSIAREIQGVDLEFNLGLKPYLVGRVIASNEEKKKGKKRRDE